MKYYTKREISESKVAFLVEITCDLCGRTIRMEGNDPEVEITVRQRDGNGVDYKIDICLNCLKNKLNPWLIENLHMPTQYLLNKIKDED